MIQFSYTCIQEHPVWVNQQFWEDSFHADVEKQIRQLYLTPEEVKAEQELQQLNLASSPVNVRIDMDALKVVVPHCYI